MYFQLSLSNDSNQYADESYLCLIIGEEYGVLLMKEKQQGDIYCGFSIHRWPVGWEDQAVDAEPGEHFVC